MSKMLLCRCKLACEIEHTLGIDGLAFHSGLPFGSKPREGPHQGCSDNKHRQRNADCDACPHPNCRPGVRWISVKFYTNRGVELPPEFVVRQIIVFRIERPELRHVIPTIIERVRI